MIDEKFIKVASLIGEEEFSRIQNKKVYIAGLGGVGGTTFMALVRSGVRNFVIVDKDKVAPSNLNRQVFYDLDDINRPKALVAAEKAGLISQDLDLEVYQANVEDVLPRDDIDFIVDCIDDVEAKITLIKYAQEHHIPLITSMGMANKMDPTKIKYGTLNKSSVDPLAKKMRYELKRRGIDYSSIMCVYSDETPTKDGNKLNSLITVTSTAGLYIASFVLNNLKSN